MEDEYTNEIRRCEAELDWMNWVTYEGDCDEESNFLGFALQIANESHLSSLVGTRL